MKSVDKILLVAVGFLVVVFFCYVGFQSGYTHGKRDGFNDGRIEAWNYYPQMTIDSLSLNTSCGELSLYDVVIVGEDEILKVIGGDINGLVNGYVG